MLIGTTVFLHKDSMGHKGLAISEDCLKHFAEKHKGKELFTDDGIGKFSNFRYEDGKVLADYEVDINIRFNVVPQVLSLPGNKRLVTDLTVGGIVLVVKQPKKK